MAKRTTRSSNTPSLSGFGGSRLASVAADGEEAAAAISTLDELGVGDAEQLLALAAVPGLASELQAVLGLEERPYQALVDAARGAVPIERAGLLDQPTSIVDLHLGVLDPTAEMLASAEATTAAESAEAAEAAPAAMNLIPYFPPIRQQASRGTCVAFTLTALHEYALTRQQRPQNLSEQHLYYEVKLIDGAPGDCGTWQAKAVLPLRSRGQCREAIWPYDPNPPCNNHGARPAGARVDALQYRLTTFAVATRDVAAYKAELARQRPVTLSIPVYDSWYRSAETRRSGRITTRIGGEAAVGGHAVCLVGYQDAAGSPGGGYFLVRNSWGTGWAYQSPYGAGYGTIPYRYITDDAWEAYSTVVAGIGDDEPEDEPTSTDAQSVVIEVGKNIKITINSG